MLGPLLLDPFDLAGRLLGLQIESPSFLYWAIFGVGLFFAVAFTFHDLRKSSILASEENIAGRLKRLGYDALFVGAVTFLSQNSLHGGASLLAKNLAIRDFGEEQWATAGIEQFLAIGLLTRERGYYPYSGNPYIEITVTDKGREVYAKLTS